MSFFDLLRRLGGNNANNGYSSSAVAANADGSIFERLEFLQAGQQGTAGIAAFPAAAAPANGVSMAEVQRDLWDAIRNGTGGSEPGTNKSIIDALGFDGSARLDVAGGLGYDLLALPRCCEKSDGAVLTGDDDLFVVTGGPIKVLEITGIVTTIIGGASDVKLTYTTVTPAATVDLSAGAVAIDDDAAGTSYQTINTTGVFTPVTAGVVKEANSFATLPTTFLLPIGTMKLNSSAAQTGNIKWYLRYVPLSPLSRVAAAA